MQIASQSGAAAASEATSVPIKTVQSWISKEARKQTLRASAVHTRNESTHGGPVQNSAIFSGPGDEVEWGLATLRQARATVDLSIKRSQELLPKSKSLRDVSATGRGLLKGAQELADRIERLEVTQAAISEAQVDYMYRICTMWLEALGFSPDGLGAAAVRLFVDLARRAEAGGVIVASPELVEEARRALHGFPALPPADVEGVPARMPVEVAELVTEAESVTDDRAEPEPEPEPEAENRVAPPGGVRWGWLSDSMNVQPSPAARDGDARPAGARRTSADQVRHQYGPSEFS
jgi:hypothetical protein